MRIYTGLSLMLLCATYAGARTITVTDTDKQPISGVKVTLYDEHSDSIGCALTNARGEFELVSPPAASFVFESPDYTAMLVYVERLKTDSITLQTGKILDEVVVMGDEAKRHLTHTTYRLSQKEMRKYGNFFECLDAIPLVTVLPGSSRIFYRGHANVAVLVDGVQTTVQELQTISKNDISRIDVYDNPPAQYINQGFGSMVDVITKSGLRGGNAGINLQQSPWPLNGGGTAAVYYNYKRSKWSAIFDNTNQHGNDTRFDQMLDYDFDGVNYDKRKEGMKSKSRSDDNRIRLSFQNNKTMDYLYNVRLSGGINATGRNYLQDVTRADGASLTGDNHLSTNSKDVSVENYFEKYLGNQGSGGNLSATVLFTHRDIAYASYYKEYSPAHTDAGLVDSRNRYDMNYNSVMAWLSYRSPYYKAGQTSFTVFNNYRKSSYDDAENPIFEKTDELSMTARQTYRYKWLTIQPALGMAYNHISTNGEVQNIWRPYVQLQLNGNFNNGLGIEFSYTMLQTNPSIAQLTTTNQWLDTKLVYHGNPDLKAYKQHNLSLFASWYSNRYIMFDLQAAYNHMPGYILDHYVLTDDYYLQTLENMKRYSELKGTLNLYLYPFGIRDFTIMSQLVGGKIWGHGSSYSWNGYRYLWNVSAIYRNNRWTFMATYSYPGKLAEGQLVMLQPQIWQLFAQFRPTYNTSVGLSILNPFDKSVKSGERTVAEAPVDNRSYIYQKDLCNMVRIHFSWNFQFGKKRINEKQSIKISDDETGILTK